MTLPVSSYEELLTRVRSLTQETRQLQRQLDSPLLDLNDNEHSMSAWDNSSSSWNFGTRSGPPLSVGSPDPLVAPLDVQSVCDPKVINSGQCNGVLARLLGWPSKEEVTGPETKEQDERRTTPETSVSCSDGGGGGGGGGGGTQKWPAEYNVWHSVGPTLQHNQNCGTGTTPTSVSTIGPPIKQEETGRSYSQQQLGAKVEMVYSLLSMLGTHDREQMTTTLLAMSSSPDSCQAMRQSGCVPLLVQLVHAREESGVVRQRASQALHNLVHCHTDDKRGRREARVLRLLQQLIDFSDNIPHLNSSEQDDQHPGAAIAALMKLSFDEEHRLAMCQLGALHAIATLIQVDAETHGSQTNNQTCVTVRRYAGMALTNLTFGDSNNKALLCSLQPFMMSLVAQLSSPSEDLRQVTASVLRNLSWRADASSKAVLREVGTVTALMHAAMEAKKESTLKSILSALWNLSAHCNLNKVEICSVEGALQYLVEMLSFQAPSRTLAIVESAGGILRNISSHIAVREDYRNILREQNCLPLLLHQLKSPSLTVVSNACGTLWNLSARCPQDQRALWDLGAIPMLRSLVHSKHRMISMGASAALKNLLASRPDTDLLDRTSKGMPTLLVRKRRALEQELDATLSETCENIESPERWDSHESITSTHSENIFDRTSRSHCHRSGSLQLVKRSNSGGGGNTNTTTISASSLSTNTTTPNVPDGKNNAIEQRQKNNSQESHHDVTNADTVGEEQFLVNDMQRLSLNNKTVINNDELTNNKCNKESSENESVELESQTTDEKPVDYSLKYKDDNTTVIEDRCENKPAMRNTNHKLQRRLNRQKLSPEIISPANVGGSGDNNHHRHHHNVHQHHNLTIEELDMPTDYSLKYHEVESKTHDYNLIVRYGQQPDIASAEVEIDQPTDYSLKYRESDTSGGCDGEQTVVEVNSVKSNQQLPVGDGSNDNKNVPDNIDLNDSDNVASPHISDSGHYAETDLDGPIDYYSDDKVQTYCTEGTPYAFSTATSMSDLRVPDTDQPATLNNHSHKSTGESMDSLVPEVMDELQRPPASSISNTTHDVNTNQKEEAKGCKAVTFETPLMFSRCSSPESLSSYEPPDDRSSVVSEFSRLTSGMVSPSELPDSPTQTVPPSPKNIKPPVAIASTAPPTTVIDDSDSSVPLQQQTTEPNLRTQSDTNVCNTSDKRRPVPIGSLTSPISAVSANNSLGNNDNTTACVSSGIFEDTVSSFKEENTPVHFSTCTSLSSLTFDDEPSYQQNQQDIVKRNNDKGDKDKDGKQQQRNSTGGESGEVILAPVSEEEDEEEDVMLAACINIGMQQQNLNTRQPQLQTSSSPSVVKSNNLINSRLPKPKVSTTGIPIKSNVTSGSPVICPSATSNRQNVNCGPNDNTGSPLTNNIGFNEDSIMEFCTEGTPANISHATSHSDLSMLCALSDDGSSDQDNILAECIQSAMPQAKHLKQRQQNSFVITPTKTDDSSTGHLQNISSSSPSEPPQRPHEVSPAAPALIPNSPRRVRELKSVGAQDEVEFFATEGSPGVFSTRSSLSDLTINSTSKSFTTDNNRCQVVSPAPLDDGSSPLSSLEPEVTVLSRQPSAGSLTLSGDWNEEQALLELCITSGMPKTKNGRNPSVGATLQDIPADVDSGKLMAAADTEPDEKRHPAITVDQQPLPQQSMSDPMQASADTWNDDASFPSISLTAPMITSYKSCTEDDKSIKCLDDMSLTDSNIIRLEEGKVAIISHMEMESSFLSDIDSVRPPSAMGSLLSLTTSISEAEKRKDKMRGLVARRALGGDSSLSWNNIDSIKPPSGMDEIMDLENSILSVASITSEVADSSLHSQHSEADSHSEDITLADTSESNLDPIVGATTISNQQQISHALYSSSPPQRSNHSTNRTTPKQKRQIGKDRYNTYTINTEETLQNGVSHENSLMEVQSVGLESDDVTMCEDDVNEDLMSDAKEESANEYKRKVQRVTPKQRRLADKDRFRTRTLGVGEDNFTNQRSSSPDLEANNPIANQIQKNFVSASPSIESEGESQSQDDDIELEKGKPRVVKPVLTPLSPAASDNKGVRGRKKVVHSHIPVVSKPSAAVKPIQLTNTPPPLQRQGTFTKDDQPITPSGIPVLAKKGSPVKTVKKKQTPTHSTTANNSQSSTTTPAVRKIAGRGRAGSLPRTETTKKPATGVRNSVSNQSLKSEALGSNSSLNSSPVGSSPRGWNSNSNLNSAKKDATSKIASLWKKVEDTKRKDTGAKDSRVWIAPNTETVSHSKQAA